MAYIATTTCFYNGTRYRAGQEVPFNGKGKLPKWLKEKTDDWDDIPPEGEGFEGAGMVTKGKPADRLQMPGTKKPVNATRHAKAMLAEYNIDPESVEGTGPEGQILKGDVEQFVEMNTG